MKIAVLGLGRMGQAIAHRLHEGNHDLFVWNRSKGKAAELVNVGALEANDVGDAVASTEVVITSLTNDEAVRDIALGKDGLRTSIGTRLYVDTSTISPSLSCELGQVFERFVALPVLGAPQAVRAGEATYLAGGPPDLINHLRPISDSLGSKIKRYPNPEMAATAKLAVNLLLLSGIGTLAEAVTVGRTGGLSDEQLGDLLGETPMLAPGLKNRFDAVLRGSGPKWWTTVLAAKDAGLAIDTVQSDGTTLRLAEVLLEMYGRVADEGFDDEDMVAVARLYE